MDISLYQAFDENLKNNWNELLAESVQHVPFLRYEYLQHWWETRGGGEWVEDSQLAIVIGREGDRIVGIAPLFAANWQGIDCLLLLGSIEISDYLDMIVRPTDVERFCAELLAFLMHPENEVPKWQRLELYNVLESSPTLPALENAARQAGLGFQIESFRPAMTVSLPGDWDGYLAGIDKKQRHEIRRKMRRAYASDLPVRWYVALDPDTIDDEINDFLNLMERDPEKASFLTPSMRDAFRETIRCAFDLGCLQLAFLEIGGEKAAGYMNFDYLDQIWVYNSGMNFDFTEFSPGWVLLGELLKWANENGRKSFDFMRGDEDYKARFGAHQRDVMRVILEKTRQSEGTVVL